MSEELRQAFGAAPASRPFPSLAIILKATCSWRAVLRAISPVVDRRRDLPTMSQTDCIITGNSDLYGLGIRLGGYLLWASTQIA